ncbi:MAG: hybrid sensor histidine kinase/response regulator [Gemmataceae bacterium]|nr:hybrid sensor histidine kinase/response regulator [Gemmataceae bacterium]
MIVKPCLLVVDDEPDLVQSVKDLLRFDYRVLGATRAGEGLALLSREDVHVVMSDQRMPEMTGVEFLKRVKDNYPDAIRLLFTAYADLNAVTDAINQGNVYRYISKPWEPDELRTVLRQAVDQHRLQAERKRLIKEVQEKNAQLEAANQELQEANELKRAFIKVASHELRTPLTLVLGLSEFAYKQGRLPPPMDDWLKQIYEASSRLNDRVDLMVKLLQAGRFERPLQPADVPLADLVRGAAQTVHSFIAERGQKLTLDVADDPGTDLGTVRVERDKMHDCIVQLLINSIKFTPDGGAIRLEARRTADGGAAVAVRDTGKGIDAASLERIFDPFFTRFDVSRHRSGTFEFDRRGLGLGLTVVKTFVEMHGGEVKVESRVNEGTTFTIVLPPAPPATAEPAAWSV